MTETAIRSSHRRCGVPCGAATFAQVYIRNSFNSQASPWLMSRDLVIARELLPSCVSALGMYDNLIQQSTCVLLSNAKENVLLLVR